MSKRRPHVAALIAFLTLPLSAQPMPSLVASGYLLPTGAIVAPGQVLRPSVSTSSSCRLCH
jgi:hypothetical protein